MEEERGRPVKEMSIQFVQIPATQAASEKVYITVTTFLPEDSKDLQALTNQTALEKVTKYGGSLFEYR